MQNTLPVLSAGRQPRGVVRVGGAPVAGWYSWSVTQNTFYEADTFRVDFALDALPTSMNAAWFTLQPEIFVEVFAGFPSDPDRPLVTDNMQSLIYGRVDEIEIDPLNGTMSLSGRDLTAAFIDARVVDEWSNSTSSQIATSLAGAHGLTPVVTATTTNVGTYYQHDQVRLQTNQSEWDLLAWLARTEGFVCYVTGQELHFEPAPTETVDPYVIRWDSNVRVTNVQTLRFSRALTVAKGIVVTVRSASIKNKTAVVASYPSKAKVVQAGKASPFGNTQNYYYTLAAGMAFDQCENYAVARYKEIVAHEMRISGSLPGDNLLSPLSVVQVQGTGTAIDQDYYPTSITREMSLSDGYSMSFEARNSNPLTVAQ